MMAQLEELASWNTAAILMLSEKGQGGCYDIALSRCILTDSSSSQLGQARFTDRIMPIL